MAVLGDYFSHYGGKEFPVPEIAGRYEGKRLIICADAACVWDDLERLGARSNRGRGKVEMENMDFMVVNKLGEVFPGNIEHWYSNEAKLLQTFEMARRNEYRNEFSCSWHTHSNHRGAKWHWPLGGHGTSGLSAILVGLLLGYERIVLCGMPLDDGPHNGEPPWRSCKFESAEVADTVGGGISKPWKYAIDHAFQGRVRSMSGRTKKWLG
jgi:hypothetical protein